MLSSFCSLHPLETGKLAACSRPIGGQIGDITNSTNRRVVTEIDSQIDTNIPLTETPGPMDPGI